MAKVTKRGDKLQSKKLELLEYITSTVREIYKIKGPIKDVRTVIDALGGKWIKTRITKTEHKKGDSKYGKERF